MSSRSHNRFVWKFICVGKAIDAFSDEDMPEPPWLPTALPSAFAQEVWALAEHVLSVRDMDIVKQYYADGYSGVEIGLFHGITQARVSQVLSKARDDIRAELARRRSR